ncbi:MAG TPA: ABC transporter substrate-binding protein [Chloroflexota bacterium]|nr:ABC transporter substrate-binding protein [Chloroflexota bacterium]
MSDSTAQQSDVAATVSRKTLLKAGAALSGAAATGSLMTSPTALAAPALLRHYASSKTTLVLGVTETSATMDPGVNWDYGVATISPACYEGLMKAWRGDTSSILEKDLAESYTRSSDGLTYTFRLQKGIKFADGSPLTAEAVKFTFDRVSTLNLGPAILFQSIKELDVLDDLNIRIKLKYPFGPFLRVLASPWGPGIINPTLVKKHSKNAKDFGQAWLYNHSAGSGPYVLDSWDQARNQATLVRNTHWWRGWPAGSTAPDTVIIRWIKDSATHRLLLEQGELDASVGINGPDFEALQSNPIIVTARHLSPRMRNFKFNVTKAPLNDVRVRRALAHTFDCERVINDVLRGNAFHMDSVIARGYAGYAPASIHYNYDLNAAKQLLKQAGHGDGFSLDIQTSSDWPPSNSVVEFWQASLSQVGVKVSIREMPNSTYFQVINSPKTAPQVQTGGLGPDYADAFEPLSLSYDIRNAPFDNSGYYRNDKVSAMLDKAKAIVDDQKRYAAYKPIINTVAADSPSVWCIQDADLVALRKNVTGYQYSFLLTKAFFPLALMGKK